MQPRPYKKMPHPRLSCKKMAYDILVYRLNSPSKCLQPTPHLHLRRPLTLSLSICRPQYVQNPSTAPPMAYVPCVRVVVSLMGELTVQAVQLASIRKDGGSSEAAIVVDTYALSVSERMELVQLLSFVCGKNGAGRRIG